MIIVYSLLGASGIALGSAIYLSVRATNKFMAEAKAKDIKSLSREELVMFYQQLKNMNNSNLPWHTVKLREIEALINSVAAQLHPIIKEEVERSLDQIVFTPGTKIEELSKTYVETIGWVPEYQR